jgi:hypothetical protein
MDVVPTSCDPRITLITHAMLGVFSQNLRGRAAVFQVLNRLFTLLFRPFGFLVFKKVTPVSAKNTRYQLIYHSLQDPLYKPSFEKELSRFFSADIKKDKDPAIFTVGAQAEEYLHQIFHLPFYVGLVETSFVSSAVRSVDERKFRFVFHKRGSSAASRDFLSLLDSSNYQALRGIVDISHGMNQELSSLTAHYGKVVDHCPVGIASREDQEFVGSLIRRVNESVLEKEYAKLWDSPLICPQRKNPSNIFFFMRTYTRRGLRFGLYDYDVRFMFPPSQRLDIQETFETIRYAQTPAAKDFYHKKKTGGVVNLAHDDRYWYFLVKRVQIDKSASRHKRLYNLRVSSKPERNLRYPNTHFDESFWTHLANDHSVSELLSCVESPFGENARSMSDTVFSSGVASTLYRPFAEGGLERVTSRETKKGYGSCDVRRLLASHYLFSAMAPKSDDLAILLIPIFLSGSVWLVIGVIADVRAGDGHDSEKLPKETWNRFYHYYYDIGVRLAKRIRSSAKQMYSREVYVIVFAEMEILVELIVSRTQFSLRNTIANIRSRLLLLSRVYPFDIPDLESLESHDHHNKDAVNFEIFKGSGLWVRIVRRENKHFPRLVTKEYLTYQELQEPVRAAVANAEKQLHALNRVRGVYATQSHS